MGRFQIQDHLLEYFLVVKVYLLFVLDFLDTKDIVQEFKLTIATEEFYHVVLQPVFGRQYIQSFPFGWVFLLQLLFDLGGDCTLPKKLFEIHTHQKLDSACPYKTLDDVDTLVASLKHAQYLFHEFCITCVHKDHARPTSFLYGQ